MKFNIHILTFFLFTIFTIIISGCGKSVLDQSTSALNRALPDETSHDVSIYAYKENRVDYILTASRIERFYLTSKLNAWNVKIVTYDEKMNVKSNLSADTTYVDEARNYIQALGNVVFETPNGIIKSRSMNWERVSDEIFSNEKVTLIRDGNTLQGDNLRTNSNISFVEMSTITAEGTVKGDELDW